MGVGCVILTVAPSWGMNEVSKRALICDDSRLTRRMIADVLEQDVGKPFRVEDLREIVTRCVAADATTV